MATELENALDELVEIVRTSQKIKTKYPLVTFFNRLTGKLIVPFTLYMRWYYKKDTLEAIPLGTYKSRAYDIRAFLRFLVINDIAWEDFDRTDFASYIEVELENTYKRQAVRDEQAAKISMNDKIEAVYDFYEFAQKEGMVQQKIGPHEDYDIPTLLKSEWEERKAEEKRRAAKGGQKRRFRDTAQGLGYRPLRFAKLGDRNTIRHFATEEQINDLMSYLASQNNYFKAERDLLLAAVLRYTAFRIDSCASLTIDEFKDYTSTELAILSDKDKLPVTPPRLKNNHKKFLMVSVRFLKEVRAYIDGPRAKMLKELGVLEAEWPKELFLSVKDGTSLTTDYLGDVIRDGFRAVGVDERHSGPHAIRRFRGDEWMLDEYRESKEAGGLLSESVLTHRVSRNLLHASGNLKTARDHYQRTMDKIREETSEAHTDHTLRDQLALREYEIKRQEVLLNAKQRRLEQLAQQLNIDLDSLDNA